MKQILNATDNLISHVIELTFIVSIFRDDRLCFVLCLIYVLSTIVMHQRSLLTSYMYMFLLKQMFAFLSLSLSCVCMCVFYMSRVWK